jgi:hypothetical protein
MFGWILPLGAGFATRGVKDVKKRLMFEGVQEL